MDPVLLWLVGVVVLAYAVQTAAGFGAGLVGLTLGAVWLEVPEVLAVLIPLSTLQTGWVALQDRKYIAWSYLLRWVLPGMGLGTLLGFWVLQPLTGPWLKPLAGTVVLALVALEWLLGADATQTRTTPAAVRAGALLASGVMHGLAGVGGPLLVWASVQTGLPKRSLRGTLGAIWVLMNGLLALQLALSGAIDATALARIAWMLPAMALGATLGQWLFSRVDERRFRQGVFGLLAVGAVALISQGMR